MIEETALAARLRARPWAEIIYLLTLTLTRDPYSAPATLTIRLSDRPYRYPEPPPEASATMLAPTEQWLPFVRSWGGIGDAIDPHNGGVSVAALDVVLDNSRPIAGVGRFSDLIHTTRNATGYDFPFSPAELRQVFKGTGEGDRYRLFRLVIEELTNVSDETCTLKMSGIELVLEDYDRLPRITTDRFPFAAPEAVGQAVPMLLGHCRNVPLLFTRAGLVDKLREPITAIWPANGGTLKLSTPDRLARFPAAGVVQVKTKASTLTTTATTDNPNVATSPAAFQRQGEQAECIAYQAINPTTAELLQITRGARSTLPGDVDAGQDVYQVLDEYVGIAGVNLGPVVAQALTAVYADGMSKLVETPPAHTIELANMTYWPPHSLTLVRFRTAATDDLIPWAKAVEMKSVVQETDPCYTVDTVSDVGGEFVLPNGTYVNRVGVDAPCGSPFNNHWLFVRFNIAELPTDPGQQVLLRFYRGVYPGMGTNTGGMPAGYGIGFLDLIRITNTAASPTGGWDGPISAGGIHSDSGIIARLSPPPAGPSTPSSIRGWDFFLPGSPYTARIIEPGQFLNQYVFVNVSTAYAHAKAEGNPQLLFLFYVHALRVSSNQIAAGAQIYTTYTANWYGIGARVEPYIPTLFLFTGTGGGAGGSLLTRPNAGTAARSAAEASLGFVTVDVTGPTDPFLCPSLPAPTPAQLEDWYFAGVTYPVWGGAYYMYYTAGAGDTGGGGNPHFLEFASPASVEVACDNGGTFKRVREEYYYFECTSTWVAAAGLKITRAAYSVAPDIGAGFEIRESVASATRDVNGYLHSMAGDGNLLLAPFGVNGPSTYLPIRVGTLLADETTLPAGSSIIIPGPMAGRAIVFIPKDQDPNVLSPGTALYTDFTLELP
jgi:hypothetical protein